MDLKKLAFSLTLTASLFAGCGDDGASTTSTTSTTSTNTTSTTLPPVPDLGMCGDAANPITYRLSQVNIPTDAQATGGEDVGHNVDGIGTSCDTPDYAGGVDNSLIALNEALPTLSMDVNLQAEIDNALNCAVGDTTCTRLDLLVTVATGAGCVTVSVEDADGVVLAGPFVGTLDANGNMEGRVASLDLSIPFAVEGGPAVDVDLSVTNVIITGTRTDTALTNVVIGGALEQTAFEGTIMALLANTSLGDTVMFEDIQGILSSLYDVEIGGTCSALSVGLTASGEVVTP